METNRRGFFDYVFAVFGAAWLWLIGNPDAARESGLLKQPSDWFAGAGDGEVAELMVHENPPLPNRDFISEPDWDYIKLGSVERSMILRAESQLVGGDEEAEFRLWSKIHYEAGELVPLGWKPSDNEWQVLESHKILYFRRVAGAWRLADARDFTAAVVCCPE